MPTTITHAVAGAGLGALLAPGPVPAWYHALTPALALLPDADVVAFWLRVPYGSRWGHRGFSHSLAFALVMSLPAAGAVSAWLRLPFLLLWGCFFLVVASHSLLDALTNGGMGVALFAPFDCRRYFFPWRPIQVSPIGLAVFSRWGWRALRSELAWVWLPLGLALGMCAVARRLN
jgi:inner membrane protein